MSRATPEEREWLARARELGCMVANEDCGGEIHMQHITDGGRRVGHLHSYPLCAHHHHWDSPLPIGDAFHKGSKRWKEKHGDHDVHLKKAQELWEQLA